MADQDARALLLTIQANTELLRSNLSAAERAVEEFTNQTKRHLEESDAKFELFGKSLERLEGPLERLKQLGEGAFAFLIGESLIEKGKEALEFAGNIEFMAKQIGVSTDFLQKFQYAAGQSGASIEVTNTSLIKFSRSVGEAANGNKEVIKLFNDLGVKVLDSAGKVRSVESIYGDTAEGIKKIGDPARRTADTLTLFGRGAGALIPVLSGGKEGFNQLAAAAEQLGIVLGPELIEHSEEVNHKMAALREILDAQMASAVAQNAAAIGQLAGQFVSLAGGLAQFFSHNPREAFGIIGGLIGLSRGGLPGAAIGAVVGVGLGAHIDGENRDASLDRQVRSEDLVKAGRAYEAAKRGAGGASTSNYRFSNAPDVGPARDEYIRQLALFRTAKAKGFAAEPEKEDLGSTEAGDHNPDISRKKKGKSADQLAREAEAARQKALHEDAAYQAELGRAHSEYEKAEAQLADTARTELNAELESLQFAKDQKDKEIDLQLSEGRINEAQAARLKNLNALTEADQEELAQRKYQKRLVDEAADRQALQLQGAVALLELDDRLATTRQERLRIELKLLAYNEQMAIAAQQRIIDENKANPNSEAARNAQTTIDQIKAQSGRNQDQVRQANASPLNAYRQQLQGLVGDGDALNDSLENVAVGGIKGLQDGFLGVIEGTKTVSAAFRDMAASIISDLLRIGAEKIILGVLGFSEGGEVPSVLHLAGGGDVFGPGGPRDDKVPAMLSAGEYVINAASTARHRRLVEAINSDSLPHLADGGMAGPVIRTPTIPMMTRAAAAPQVIYVQIDKSELFDTHVVRVAAPLAQAAMVGGAQQAQQDFADQRMASIP